MLLPSICLDTITVTTTVTIQSDGPAVVTAPPPPASVVSPRPAAPPSLVIAPPALVASPPSLVASSPAPIVAPSHSVLLAVAAGSGLGFDTKDHCEDLECAALAIDVGVAVHRGFYAVLAAQLWDSPEHPGAARHHAETLGLRMQGERAWGEAGLGIGSTRTQPWYDVEYMKQDLDIAASAALGYDAVVRPTYALGVQARASTTPDVEHTLVSALMLGITWY